MWRVSQMTQKVETVMPHKFSYSIYKMSIYKMSTWISLGEKTSNEDGREEGLDDITYCFKVEKRVYSSRVHFIVTLVHVTSEFCSPFCDPNCYDCRQQYKTELRETTKEHATTTGCLHETALSVATVATHLTVLCPGLPAPGEPGNWNIHPLNGSLSGTTQVSRYQKGKSNLDFTGARDSEWQWHQLEHMQVCTSLQTDNHASTPPLSRVTENV